MPVANIPLRIAVAVSLAEPAQSSRTNTEFRGLPKKRFNCGTANRSKLGTDTESNTAADWEGPLDIVASAAREEVFETETDASAETVFLVFLRGGASPADDIKLPWKPGPPEWGWMICELSSSRVFEKIELIEIGSCSGTASGACQAPASAHWLPTNA